jgi:hypothetical protein
LSLPNPPTFSPGEPIEEIIVSQSKWKIPKHSVLKTFAERGDIAYDPKSEPTSEQLSKPYWNEVYWTIPNIMDYIGFKSTKVWRMVVDGKFEGAFQI